MKYEMYQSANGEWRWRLKALNGAVISISSEGYSSKANCEHSIQLNKSSASAPVYQV